jgi:hypothetical protein
LHWPPVIASPDAMPYRNMTIINRSDGRRQWTYNGMPLYTHADDANACDVRGTNEGGGLARGPLARAGLLSPSRLRACETYFSESRSFLTTSWEIGMAKRELIDTGIDERHVRCNEPAVHLFISLRSADHCC